jgi:hypothetical protein
MLQDCCTWRQGLLYESTFYCLHYLFIWNFPLILHQEAFLVPTPSWCVPNRFPCLFFPFAHDAWVSVVHDAEGSADRITVMCFMHSAAHVHAFSYRHNGLDNSPALGFDSKNWFKMWIPFTPMCSYTYPVTITVSSITGLLFFCFLSPSWTRCQNCHYSANSFLQCWHPCLTDINY